VAQHKIIAFSTAGGALRWNKVVETDYETYKYIFRAGHYNNTQIAYWLAKFATKIAKDLGLKRVGLVGENILFVRETHNMSRILLTEAGLDIVYEGLWSVGTIDYSSYIQEIVRRQVQLLIPVCATTSGIVFIQQAYDTFMADGRGPLIVGFDVYGSDFLSTWNATRGKVQGYIVEIYLDRVPLTVKTIPFWDKFRSKFGYVPFMLSASATYDAIYLYKAAVEKAGTFDTEKVIKALESFNATSPFIGVQGKIAFTKNHCFIDGPDYRPVLIAQWWDGELKTIYPEKFAARELRLPPWKIYD
jgi:branched-chain amino acid transport system substrate-binding protein